MDGSKNHPVFKQKSSQQETEISICETDPTLIQDENVAEYVTVSEQQTEGRDPGACLFSCLVGLQMIAHLPTVPNPEILWQNDLCNSALSGKGLYL